MAECIESLRDFQQKERTWHENVWHTESTIHDRIASRHREVDAHIRTIVRGTPRYEGSKLSSHSELWRNRPDLDLASAVPGSFALTPHDGMLADLRRDYEAMSGMILGPIPNVDAVVAATEELEQRLNRGH